jgi:hypothetical protein
MDPILIVNGHPGRWKNREPARNHPHTARTRQGSLGQTGEGPGRCTNGAALASNSRSEDTRTWLDVDECPVRSARAWQISASIPQHVKDRLLRHLVSECLGGLGASLGLLEEDLRSMCFVSCGRQHQQDIIETQWSWKDKSR